MSEENVKDPLLPAEEDEAAATEDLWAAFEATTEENPGEPAESAAPLEAPVSAEVNPLPDETVIALPLNKAEAQTRPLTEFERRTLALLGNPGKGATGALPEDSTTLLAVPWELSQATPPPAAAPKSVFPPPAPENPLPEPEETEFFEKRDYRPIRFSREGRLGCMSGIMYAVFVVCVSVVLAIFLWMAASDVLALNKDMLTAQVTLPTNLFQEEEEPVTDKQGNVIGSRTVHVADISQVSSLLKDYGIINYEWLFKLYAKVSDADRKIDPGTYELSTIYDYRALVKKMQVGSDSQLQVSVTFPEGFTMAQIFARLEEKGICSREDLLEAAATAEYSYAFLEGAVPGDAGRLEGFLFPDTYYFYPGMQASSAINKFLATLHYKITADMWQQALDRGMTFRKIVAIAALIEKEAANDEERPLIASVIYNRLNIGMPLQIDASILYPLQGTDITHVTPELIASTDSPYNTYLYTGLPPGPICNPGLASIKAALQPLATQYFYYALDTETKTHRFFIYESEHTAFVATQDYGA